MSYRTRSRGGFSKRYAAQLLYVNGVLSATYPSYADVGQYDTMTDVVTKPFIPGKTLVNSPKWSTKTSKEATPASGSQSHSSGTQNQTGSYFWSTEGFANSLLAKCHNTNYSNLIQLASTKALSGVKKPEASGYVTLLEAKETIKSLMNPISGVLNYLKRNVPSRKKRIPKRSKKENAREIAIAISEQHLSIIFGILPFISDIQNILKALQAIEPLPVRMTSRGSASSVATQTGSKDWYVFYEDAGTKCEAFDTCNVTQTVSVRAYILYEASVSLTSALGLSVSEIPKAAWQVATLSFVVDWFANVGEFISAITPVEGITYLASGYTVDIVQASNGTHKQRVTMKPGSSSGWTGAWDGAEDSRVIVSSTRVPGDLISNISLALKSNMHRDILDTYKVTAGISLITQRLGKFL